MKERHHDARVHQSQTMNYTVTSSDQNQDDYVTNAPYDYVSSLLRAASEKNVGTLHGIGAAMGSLALFGRPRGYGEDGKPITYGMAPTTRLIFPGSSSERRTIPKGTTHGFSSWDIYELDPRELTGTQQGLQIGAMEHYLSGIYRKNAEIFDRSQGPGNDHPVIVGFMNKKLILAGHHRSATALLMGESVIARYKHIS
jgi:hypothetical protein